MKITTEELRRLLSYDETTGVFRWLEKRGRRVNPGDAAGCIASDSGYVLIRIFNKLYRAHRLAWQYVHGQEPSNDIDHINGSRTDNRIENLRPCYRRQNIYNQKKRCDNTSGYKGVCWSPRDKKFRAYISHNHKQKYLGTFDSAEIAAIVYDVTALEIFGPFAKTNF